MSSCRSLRLRHPRLYVQDPLRVFELDFEANLEIVRQCARTSKTHYFSFHIRSVWDVSGSWNLMKKKAI